MVVAAVAVAVAVAVAPVAAVAVAAVTVVVAVAVAVAVASQLTSQLTAASQGCSQWTFPCLGKVRGCVETRCRRGSGEYLLAVTFAPLLTPDCRHFICFRQP